jgi:tryptophanyl-tRNA synthetase
MTRVFSGIQPSGELHIGNYLGAVKNWTQLQHEHESFFCIVNYHAITVAYAPDDLRRRTREMAVSLLASGLDPAKCVVFVQSDVPEHTELQWILNTVTPLGELERQVQFKDKAGKQEQVMAGLLNYPVLRRRTSCSTARIPCPSVRTRCSIWNSHAWSRGTGTRASHPTRRTSRSRSPT